MRSNLLPKAILSVAPIALILLASGPLTAQQGFGFEASLGYQWVSGGGSSSYGKFLDGGVDGEFVAVYTRGKLRYGIGANWASYGMNAPNEAESWSNIASHLGVAFFPFERRISPFVEVRLVNRRLRPEGDFLTDLLPPEEGELPPEEGENTSDIRVDGVTGAFLLGVDIRMTDRWWVKVSSYASKIATTDVVLDEINLGTVDTGNVLGFRVGLFWTP